MTFGADSFGQLAFGDVAGAGGAAVVNTAIDPGVGSLAITGYAPTVTQTANQALVPGVGTLSITGYAPTIAQPQEVSPGAGSLAITGYSPTIGQTANQAIDPGAGSLAITGYAPTLAQTANQTIAPDVGSLALTGYAPTIGQTANQEVIPGVGSLTITGYAPTVTQAVNTDVNPGAGSLAITGYAPDIAQTAGNQISPDAGALVITGYAPEVAQTGAETPAGNMGFEMGGKGARVVSFKPLLQRIREARLQKAEPATVKARKRAKSIVVEAAKLVASDGNESAFKGLMAQWVAQRPVVGISPVVDASLDQQYQLFMAQVALRIQALEDQEEEEAVIALLML